jgi:hypothetical protein
MTIPLHSRRAANPRPFKTPSRSSSPRCSLALVTNFSHSSLRVFRDLRTLSFSGSQLSRVLSAVCALLRKKPGVHPSMVMPGSAGILFVPRKEGPANVPYLVRARRIPALRKRGAGWASPSPTKTANHGPRFLPLLVAPHRPLATSYISFISRAYEHQPRMSLVSPTYAKTGGWTPSGSKTLKLCLKCRRSDIFNFPPDISHFFTSNPLVRRAFTRRSSSGGGPFPPPSSVPSIHFLFSLFHFRLSPPHLFLPFSSAHPNSSPNSRPFPSTLR